jgi:hypothetical protein
LTKLALAIGGLIVGLSASSVVLGTSTKAGGGAVAAVRTAYGTFVATTSSTSASDIPGMSVSVTVPAGQHAVLLITFSASSFCAIGDANTIPTCSVQALLDGKTVSPGWVPFDARAGSVDAQYYPAAHSMQFVAANVVAGTHTVKMRYLISNSGDTFAVYQRTLTVLRSAA